MNERCKYFQYSASFLEGLKYHCIKRDVETTIEYCKTCNLCSTEENTELTRLKELSIIECPYICKEQNTCYKNQGGRCYKECVMKKIINDYNDMVKYIKSI